MTPRIAYLESALADEPPYRLKQILQAIYRQYIPTFGQMTFLPQPLRAKLEEGWGKSVLSLTPLSSMEDTQVCKTLFKTGDHDRFEASLLSFQVEHQHDKLRRSVCLSSQSGCAMGCTFCATGAIGFKRNLTADHIIDQVLYFQQTGPKIDSVSLMGMGEPLVNPHLWEALHCFIDADKMAMSSRSINLSTIGIPSGIERMTAEFPEVNLTVSLHSPFQEQRWQLMPMTREFSIDAIMVLLTRHLAQTRRRAFIAYTLLGQENDTLDHAKALAELIKHQGPLSYLYHVSLILFNPGDTIVPHQSPSPKQVKLFSNELTRQNISWTLRQRFGFKVGAACGQFYGEYEQKKRS